MARFPRRARLLTPLAFKQVFDHARREHTPLLTAVVSPNNVGQPRLGLAIARKAAARSVDRNRLKRQIRESFRKAQNRLPNCDIVLLARPAAARAANPLVASDLERLWTRITERWPQSSSNSPLSC